MKRITFVLALLCLALMMTGISCAEEAKEITKSCSITLDGNGMKTRKQMLDRRYSTYAVVRRNMSLEINGNGQPLGGVFLQFWDRSTKTEVQAKQNGEWVSVAVVGDHLSDWVALPEGTKEVRVSNTSRGRMFLAELYVYGEGERPARCAAWKDAESADMMVFAAHPDDELLWYGGLLPTYAGDRKLDVQVVYAVPATPVRRLEMLDGLWTCGVENYPAFLRMPDSRAKTLEGQYRRWKKDSLYGRVTEVLRRYKPAVVVTQDFEGEYGHGAHRAIADAVTKCASSIAGDESHYKASAAKYGTWQVSKVYVHLWKQNQLRMDWHVPLQSFNGEDGLSVCTRAMNCHASQVRTGWKIEDGGKCDNALFGLYFTNVGEDEEKNDLMEHISVKKKPAGVELQPVQDPIDQENDKEIEWV